MRKTGQDSDKRKSAANFMILVVGLSICSFCSDEENRGGHGRKVAIAVGSPRGSAATRDRDPDQGGVWRWPSAGAPVEAAERRSAGEEEEEEGGWDWVGGLQGEDRRDSQVTPKRKSKKNV